MGFVFAATSFRDAAFGVFAPGRFRRSVLGMTRRLPDGWFGRRAALLLRRFGMALLRHPLDVTVYGARMRLYPFANVCERRVLFTPQFFDPTERALLNARASDGFTFVDVGANVGIYALSVAALAGPRGRVIAVEPQPIVFERLVANIAFNPDLHIDAVPVALTDHDGAAKLFLDPDNEGQASIKFIMSSDLERAQINVPARSLQSLLAHQGIKRLDALKLDVAGAEDVILAPFLKHAPERLWPRIVIMENTPQRWQVDCIALLVEHGWTMVHENRMNVFLERDAQS